MKLVHVAGAAISCLALRPGLSSAAGCLKGAADGGAGGRAAKRPCASHDVGVRIREALQFFSQNLFANLGYADPETHLLKAGLVTRIRETLSDAKLNQTEGRQAYGR